MFNPEKEINEYLMRGFFMPDTFTPETCVQIQQAPGDAALDTYWHMQQQQFMPHAPYVQAGKIELLPYGPNHMLIDRLSQLVSAHNQAHFQFEIDGLMGTQRVTLGPGEGWGWHVDLAEGPFSLRKLCIVLFLSERSSYEGGAFEVSSGVCPIHQEQGSLGIMPSYFMQRITPVVSGQLQFLITWAHGTQPFQ
jgi:hypothetical protein